MTKWRGDFYLFDYSKLYIHSNRNILQWAGNLSRAYHSTHSILNSSASIVDEFSSVDKSSLQSDEVRYKSAALLFARSLIAWASSIPLNEWLLCEQTCLFLDPPRLGSTLPLDPPGCA